MKYSPIMRIFQIILISVSVCVCLSLFLFFLQRKKNADFSSHLFHSQVLPKQAISGKPYTYQHQWQLSIPPAWQVKEEKNGNGVQMTSPDFIPDEVDPEFHAEAGSGIFYSVFNQNDLSDINLLQKGSIIANDDNTGEYIIGSLTHQSVHGNQSVEYDYFPPTDHAFIRTMFAILHNKKLYRFTCSYMLQSGKTECEKILTSLQIY